MSITLNAADFRTDGEFIDALWALFLNAQSNEILDYARDAAQNRRPWALNTCITALIFTLQDKKLPERKEVRDLAWGLATQQFSLAKCNVLFLGI